MVCSFCSSLLMLASPSASAWASALSPNCWYRAGGQQGQGQGQGRGVLGTGYRVWGWQQGQGFRVEGQREARGDPCGTMWDVVGPRGTMGIPTITLRGLTSCLSPSVLLSTLHTATRTQPLSSPGSPAGCRGYSPELKPTCTWLHPPPTDVSLQGM